MNGVDLALLCAVGAASVVGYHRGLRARSRAWLGAVAGLGFGLIVAAAATRGRSGWNATTVAALAILLPTLAGYLTGRAMNRRPIYGDPGTSDHRLGALAAGSISVVLIWMLAPLVAATPGRAGESFASSGTIELIDSFGGPVAPVADMATRIDGGDRERATEALRPATGPPEPIAVPTDPVLGDRDRQDARESVVGVSGVACGSLIEGTGFVAADRTVITNAHVIAGVDSIRVDLESGQRLGGRLIAFDPATDIAVIDVPDLTAPPLPIGSTPERGATGEVLGFGGDSSEPTPYRIEGEVVATGLDIYNEQRTRRRVLYLAAELGSGQSGAPLVGDDGVAGMVFAIAPDHPRLAFALTAAEVVDALDEVTDRDGTSEAENGPCR